MYDEDEDEDEDEYEIEITPEVVGNYIYDVLDELVTGERDTDTVVEELIDGYLDDGTTITNSDDVLDIINSLVEDAAEECHQEAADLLSAGVSRDEASAAMDDFSLRMKLLGHSAPRGRASIWLYLNNCPEIVFPTLNELVAAGVNLRDLESAMLVPVGEM